MRLVLLLIVLFLVGCSTAPLFVMEPIPEIKVAVAEISAGATWSPAPVPVAVEPEIIADESTKTSALPAPIAKIFKPTNVTRPTKITTQITTELDSKGNVSKVTKVVTEEKQEAPQEPDVFNTIIDKLIKLITLLTGTLGLYVGVQKLRSNVAAPATT